MSFIKKLLSFFKPKKSTEVVKPEVPTKVVPSHPPSGSKSSLHIALVVGHESKAGGADLVGTGLDEYRWNMRVAKLSKEYAEGLGHKLSIVLRDGVGIDGAYRRCASINADCIIELHFNAANGKAAGTETLTSVNANDKDFAKYVHSFILKAFGPSRADRKIKILSSGDRGGRSLYASSLPNCLVEPFFGDNKAEVTLALTKEREYAQCLVDACVMWAKDKGMEL